MNWIRIMPIPQRPVKTIIGRGGSASAICGATIVSTRARKLHTPKAVAQKSVGKISTMQMYTLTKEPEIPIFVNTTKAGIRDSCVVPKKMMMIPPMTENVSKKVNAFLIPNFLYRNPPKTTEQQSVPELAKVLL